MATETLAIIGATIKSESSTSKSCANASTTNLLSINLPCAGVWLLSGYVQLNDTYGTSNGIILSINSSASAFTGITDFHRITCFTNNKSLPSRLSLCAPYEASSAITVYLNVYQETGAARNATYYGIKATRIA